jgi:glycosyltransferase involved in cell wall biosynthesis
MQWNGRRDRREGASAVRILIAAGIFPPEIGGPATYVPRIAEALAARGHAVTVVAPQDRGSACPIIDPPYRLVRFHRARAVRYANFFVELWRAFVTVLREARVCDVVFVNGLGLPSMLAARSTGKPMVVKVVGDGAWEIAHNRGWTKLNLDEFQEAHSFRIGLSRMLLHAAARRAQAVIAPSCYLARIVERWGVAGERIHVVYNALIPPEPEDNASSGTALPPGFDQGFRLITVGRLVPHKRIEDIIAALTRLDNANLVIVGDGPKWDNLQALTGKLRLSDRVFMTGRLPREAVWRLLAEHADVLVLNSTYEGLPHILLEAAHLGVPVVATKVGGTPEVVRDGKTGLLIPPDSPDELVGALRRLQSDSALRRRLAASGREAVRGSFWWVVKETEQVLLETTQ